MIKYLVSSKLYLPKVKPYRYKHIVTRSVKFAPPLARFRAMRRGITRIPQKFLLSRLERSAFDTTKSSTLFKRVYFPKRFSFPKKFVPTRSSLLIDDLRFFRPYSVDHVRHTFFGQPVSYTDHEPTGKMRFSDPRKTIVCYKRKLRRGFLFSNGLIGSGISQKGVNKRYTEDTQIICK